jgi:hypothetical protein
MKVYLDKIRWNSWLDASTFSLSLVIFWMFFGWLLSLNVLDDRFSSLKVLLKAYPAREMDTYPVSAIVNRPTTDAPELINPVQSS